MRNKFSELITQGVATGFKIRNIAPEIPVNDYICRTYNNIWSIPSDTHMCLDKETGKRFITGSMIKKTEQWDRFLYSINWGAVSFKNSGYWSLSDFLQKNGLKGCYSALNGDTVYEIDIIPKVDTIGYNYKCPDCCITSESKIPQNLAYIVKDNNSLHIAECYNDKSSLYEVAEALNNNIYVRGKDWTVVGENLMCPIGNKVFIL